MQNDALSIYIFFNLLRLLWILTAKDSLSVVKEMLKENIFSAVQVMEESKFVA